MDNIFQSPPLPRSLHVPHSAFPISALCMRRDSMKTYLLIFCIFAMSFGLVSSAECHWTDWQPYYAYNNCKSGFYSVKWEHFTKSFWGMPIPGRREYCCPNE
ncbi:hypothetical protein QR680_012252 [Steinernema hermaphroditum]|uniref:Uncharacterized protein n=1 Tax=Steinernema hermaphroditum TaxID=289476 RepID=A0AA39I1F1_9BILA|nr:hypothetical protein QR680_012250 [Steinernema hermaphroditum]KAK0416020.1 hypothetical protein QR680_012252 [Steinernema hermaphroditum]